MTHSIGRGFAPLSLSLSLSLSRAHTHSNWLCNSTMQKPTGISHTWFSQLHGITLIRGRRTDKRRNSLKKRDGESASSSHGRYDSENAGLILLQTSLNPTMSLQSYMFIISIDNLLFAEFRWKQTTTIIRDSLQQIKNTQFKLK